MSARALRLPGSRTARGQRTRADAQALERNAVAQRVVGRREVALDVVGQRVHAGGRRDGRGQTQRQLGVGEDLRARILAMNTMRLRWVSFSDTTAERPTSLPVPAVVGSATK